MSEFQPVLNTLIGASVTGLVLWVWALWKAHNDLRLKLAEEYTKDKAMREAVAAAVAPVQAAISEQAKALAHQGRLIEKIADRMHIPASSQDD